MKGMNQFFILQRHFFNRLFQNELIPFGEEMRASLIVILAIFAVSGGFLSNSLLFQYLFSVVPEDESGSWIQKCYFIAFFMVIIGFLSSLELKIMFPDRLDYLTFSPLPINSLVLFLAKFSSLLLFVGLFSFSSNIFASLIFPLYLTSHKNVSFLYLIWFSISHIFSFYFSNLFVLFFCAMIFGAFMILPSSIFKRIFSNIQTTLMVFFLVSFAFFPSIFSSLEKIKSNDSPFLYLFPPLWFTGLYESMLKNTDPLFLRLALISILATLLSASTFILFTILSYKKLISSIPDVENSKGRFERIKNKFISIFEKLFLPGQIQRVMFYFLRKTLKRSNVHRVYLGAYKAVAFGIILFLIIFKWNPQNFKSIFDLNRTLLSIPLIISFFVIVGIRIVITIPFSYEANWIFRLTEKEDKKEYISGIKKGVFSLLLPFFFVLFLFYSFIWGIKISFLHILYGLLLSSLLTQILFSNLKKIPFTCTFVPGKTDIKNYWPIYLFSFIGYLYIFTTLEYWMIKNDFSFLLLLILLILAITLSRKLSRKSNFDFVYEEEPEPVMISLNLNK